MHARPASVQPQGGGLQGRLRARAGQPHPNHSNPSPNPTLTLTLTPTLTLTVYALAQAIHTNRSLQKIVLEGGELPVSSLKGLNAKTSRTLDLSRQNLTFVSCVFIGALVKENATLTELNLNTNDTGPDGLTAIINQLNPVTLKTLDLSNNVRAIADAKLVTREAIATLKADMTKQAEQIGLLTEAMGRMVEP